MRSHTIEKSITPPKRAVASGSARGERGTVIRGPTPVISTGRTLWESVIRIIDLLNLLGPPEKTKKVYRRRIGSTRNCQITSRKYIFFLRMVFVD